MNSGNNLYELLGKKRSCTPPVLLFSLVALVGGASLGYWVPLFFNGSGTTCPSCLNMTELSEKLAKVEGELKQSETRVSDLTKQLEGTRKCPESVPCLKPESPTPTEPCPSCLDETEMAEKLKKSEETIAALQKSLSSKEFQIGSLRENLDGCNGLLDRCKSKTCWLDRFNDAVKEIIRNSESE